MRKLIYLLISVLCVAQTVETSYAVQLRPVTDNGTTTATISSHDITRIMIKGDRIKNLRGNKGIYTRENDNELGQVYLQPTEAFSNRAFTVLIDTEMGQHYTLLLNPLAVPADTLMLVPTGVVKDVVNHAEQASPYETRLIEIIHQVSLGKVPEFFSKKLAFKKIYKIGDVSLKSTMNYQSEKIRVELWNVSNNTEQTLMLNECDYYKPGTLAVSFTDISLKPHAITSMVRVVNHV